MAYFGTCDICGGTLDPGEHCDCESKADEVRQMQEELEQRTYIENKAIDLISQCKFEEAIETLENCTGATGRKNEAAKETN